MQIFAVRQRDRKSKWTLWQGWIFGVKLCETKLVRFPDHYWSNFCCFDPLLICFVSDLVLVLPDLQQQKWAIATHSGLRICSAFGWTVWSPILAFVIMVGSYYFHPCECGRLATWTSYWCLAGNEGMIHWLTINHDPIPSHSPIPIHSLLSTSKT